MKNLNGKKKNRFAMVVAANYGYTCPVLALINSIIEYGINEYVDLIFIYDQFDPTIFDNEYLNIRYFERDKDGSMSHMKFSRLLSLHKFANEYDAVCVMDADMFIVSDLKKFFEIASHGFPIACNNDAAIDKGFIEDENNKKMIETNLCSFQSICNVPFFFNYNKTKPIFKKYKELYEISKNKGDYYMQNCSLILNPSILSKMIIYPSVCFTGVHHTFLKYQTHFRFDRYREHMAENKSEKIIKDKFIMTKDYIRVFTVHGHFYHPGWTDNCLKKMEKYYSHELRVSPPIHKKFMNICQGIITNLDKMFIDYLCNGKIEYDKVKKTIKQHHIDFIDKLKIKYEI